MNEPQSVESIDRNPLPQRSAAPHPRAVGSPLPMGGSRHSPVLPQGIGNRIPASPSRALTRASNPEESSGLQRVVNAVRMAVPLVQRVLPLLDGNIATAVAGLLTSRSHAPAPPQPKVDLAALEGGLAELQTQHRNLREQVIEQNASLKRVEDSLGMVREATDRNTLEQQELLEELKAFTRKVKIGAVVIAALLLMGAVLNLILFLHIERVLP